MTTTKIEWADAVWNPVTGCTKVSEGCRYCYAETQAKRFWGERKFTEVRCHEDRLETPLSWKKPRRIFVNSMSDLFHKDVPDKFIGAVWSKMLECPQHTFMILTKRPYRMHDVVHKLVEECRRKGMREATNIWLLVSVEDQITADKRIPLLLRTPAAVRGVSCEPLLGAVDLGSFLCRDYTKGKMTLGKYLDWVIAGGESGRFARPVHPDWVRSLRNQCVNVGVPFFFKQWGEWEPTSVENVLENKPNRNDGKNYARLNFPVWPEKWMARVGKKKAGRLLDGRTWDEFPEERKR